MPDEEDVAALAQTSFHRLAENLHRNGFDICHPFHPRWYNEWLQQQANGLSILDEKDISGAFLIGNTKNMWPYFKRWWSTRSTIGKQLSAEQRKHPLDTFCKDTITAIVKSYFLSLEGGNANRDRIELHWASTHEIEKLVSMQRIASVSGFAYLDPHTHLAVHPIYGTWMSFRAVVVFHAKSRIPFQLPPPKMVPCLLSPQEQEIAREAMIHALKYSDLDQLCGQLHNTMEGNDEMILAWIALRDCVRVGREYRFSHDQLMYHYTKRPRYLS